MKISPHSVCAVAVLCLLLHQPSLGDENSPAEISFQKNILPIFRAKCQGCHQPAKAQGDYEMVSFEGLLKAGESGDAAIVPGDADASYLVAQIESVDGEAAMPKKGEPLSEYDVQLIRRWINEGAKNDAAAAGPSYDAENPPVYSRPPVITALAVSPDGKWLASSGFHEVLLISTASWKTEHRLVGLSERIESVSFSSDSQKLAVTGGSPGRLGEVQIWDVASGELQLSHQVTFDTVYGGTFSPDNQLVAFGCTDNTVRAIDTQSGEQKLHQGAHEDWILDCVFSPDSKHLVSAGRDMTVKLTEVETERFVDNITSITPGALRGGINALAMHPERTEVLVGGSDGTPKVYRLFRETERRIGDDANLIRQFPPTSGRIFSVDISHDGKLFAVASTLDGKSKIQVYPYDFDGKLPDDVKNVMKKRVADRKPPEKKLVEDYINKVSAATVEIEVDTSLYAVSFTANDDSLVLGGSDGQLRVLNLDSGAFAHAFVPVELANETEASVAARAATLPGSGMPLNASSIPDVSAEGEMMTGSKITQLSVEPTSISLSSPFDYAQLVVTAKMADGSSWDVTRTANKVSDAAAASVSPYGFVRYIQPGETSVKISLGNQQVVVPVVCGEAASQSTPDFTRDINPILSRLGCNSGTCHGAQKGKNGFKLSLRGYDPFEDIRALSDDLGSRRLNTAAPDASLMLLKPIGVVPHEGGVVMNKGGTHYALLRDWIAGGAALNVESKKVARIEVTPAKPVIERESAWQQFRVVAHYPDGSSRDVTQEAFIESGNSEVCESHDGGRVQAIRRGEAPILARYEGAYAAATVTVMGDREGFAWERPSSYSTIDQLVADKWKRMKILPSDLCEDHEFLRRVRLDITGLPPTAEELQAFVNDKRPSKLKRQAKVEELIGSADYVDHWTNKWADLLQVNSKFLGKEGAKAFRQWIHDAIEENRAYDQFARDVLTASGSNKTNPAASYYKILRDPDLMMENTTHLFLAIRFNCNKCHDHPFERWTQDQYYELAAYFAQTGLKADPASGNKRIGGTAVEAAKPLYEEVFDKAAGEMLHVRTNKEVEPAFPYDCQFEVSDDATRRQRLAAWITSKDNPYFARSFVNRLWGYLTGTGLMEPLDDIRAGNPPTNPELLDHLTNEFIESNFDVQHVLRLICNSKTYQLSVATNKWNADDSINYSHAKARRLPAEVLYDAVYHVTGAVSAIPGVEPGTRAAALPDVAVQLPDGFLNNLGRPVRESACECERSHDLQLGPVMALVSGPTIGKAISDPKCALPGLAQKELSDEEMVREIYRRVLSREAADEEVTAVLSTADQIEIDHRGIKAELDHREQWWAKEKASLEAARLAALEETKQKIVARTNEIAPDREKQEKARLEKLAAAEKALTDYAATSLDVANKYLKNRKNNHWFPLAATKLTASNKDQLIPQADRSIVAKGKGAKGRYDLTFRTPLKGITGFRLETLPAPELTGGGPGLPANGNFVVTEIEVDAGPAGKPKEKTRANIKAGKTDFAQSGFAAGQVFDGRTNDQKGWAVSPQGGIVHWATFQFDKPIALDDETELTFRIHQFHNAEAHRLAHFRISVTTDAGDIELGLPESFGSAQATPVAARSADGIKGLVDYLGQNDAQWKKLKSAVAEAKKPLPEDAQLVALRGQQKKYEIETPDDPKLVQLRTDFATSTNQLANRRLTLAQDLTWALINSPAFLFNH